MCEAALLPESTVPLLLSSDEELQLLCLVIATVCQQSSLQAACVSVDLGLHRRL